MNKRGWLWGMAGVMGAGLFAFLMLANANSQRVRYITYDSLEPDIWASVWMIKRHIAPESEVVIRQRGAPMEDGIVFGREDAQYKRSDQGSVYESLRQLESTGDVALQKLGKIIHDIEIAPWATPTMEESAVVEHAFRTMQDRFTDRVVPVECYGQFFDVTYRLLADSTPTQDWQTLDAFVETATASCGD